MKINNRVKRDQEIISQLEEFNHRFILGFIPIMSEPNIMQFLACAEDSIVGIPAIIDDEMVFMRWNPGIKLMKRSFYEPVHCEILDLPSEDTLCITPLVACTVLGDRLGRGGGYYDRFFAKYQKIFKVGVCYREQVLAAIPTEPHDIKLDKLILA